MNQIFVSVLLSHCHCLYINSIVDIVIAVIAGVDGVDGVYGVLSSHRITDACLSSNGDLACSDQDNTIKVFKTGAHCWNRRFKASEDDPSVPKNAGACQGNPSIAKEAGAGEDNPDIAGEFSESQSDALSSTGNLDGDDADNFALVLRYLIVYCGESYAITRVVCMCN